MKRIFSLPIFQVLLLGLLLTISNSCTTEVDPKLLPVLTTTDISKITEASAQSGGNITSDAGSDIISRGVCWSTSPNPTIEDKKTLDAAGTGIFTSKLTGLIPSTTYYVRAYATNKKGTAYGIQVTFLTKSLSVITTTVTSITVNSAISGGTVATNGDSVNASVRGICWGTQTSPTISNSKTSDGKGVGKYISSMTDLVLGTTYYLRAYVTNSGGTYYGNELSFVTQNGVLSLTTTSATSVTATSATLGGSVPNDGGSSVTERGICISKLPVPTITNKMVNGSGTGSFATNITGLTASTTYYVRAYATNSVGTTYGNEISFTTLDGNISLSTSAASSITAISATLGGSITSDGGATVTDRGICISKLPNPTISNKMVNGSGTGSFATSITGLSPNTTYYVRAYAMNIINTSYGNEVSFTTQNGVISLITTAASSITAISATLGGTITSDGGASITSSGVCWSTTSSPTTSNSKSTGTGGIGSYSSNISGLTANSTYYVRAFATNSFGTFYGNQVSFKTPPSTGTVSDIDGNIYHYITLGAQTWMVENIKTTKYNDGTVIPLVTDDTAWSNLSTGAYCFYNNDAEANKSIYGALYNWYAVNTAKLAPTGWHVATDSEWTTLQNYVSLNLGASGFVAKALAATTNWSSSTSSGAIGNDLTINNNSGFSAFPGSYRDYNGTFSYLGTGNNGCWWSSTERSSAYSWYRFMSYSDSNMTQSYRIKQSGLSVRCVRDY
ncbi:MAG: fibrobacter succinogenes major paralogous domain-containing protein [Paludibacter sp.]